MWLELSKKYKESSQSGKHRLHEKHSQTKRVAPAGSWVGENALAAYGNSAQLVI